MKPLKADFFHGSLLDMETIRDILFHPDCHRRPWLLTKSADLHAYVERSRAPGDPGYRRWGISPRPENKYGREDISLQCLCQFIFSTYFKQWFGKF